MDIYKIKDLTFSYPLGKREALSNLSVDIREGEFLVVCGQSGCGKSTFLRHLKTVLTPHGERTGEILFNNKLLSENDDRTQAAEIGYVMQNPDNQIVTDEVWHELAFGLESLGYVKGKIRIKVAEMASFFGIQDWFLKSVDQLSGGQKQLLNLAAIMAMQPRVLILDEPTAQLDPIAAADFLATVKKINRDLGTTIIISEHRLDEIFSSADRVMVMDSGAIKIIDTPANVGIDLKKLNHQMVVALPAPVQIYSAIEEDGESPLTIRDGRNWLNNILDDKEIKVDKIDKKEVTNNSPVIEFKDVWFRYEKNLEDVIKDLSIEFEKGKWHCILGGNGTGKTTMLNLVSRIGKAYRGKVILNGKNISKYSDKELFNNNLGILPQNPQSLFVRKNVRLDLEEMISGKDKEEAIARIVELVEIEDLLERHPYDISGGEQQRVALAKVLLLEPKILLLDEPTKGIDSFFKKKFAGVMRKLIDKGVTVIMVSHDIEFCAEYADDCSLFFNGNIVTTANTNTFFSGNSFYTTAANRMSSNIFKNAVTNEDVIKLCKENL